MGYINYDFALDIFKELAGEGQLGCAGQIKLITANRGEVWLDITNKNVTAGSGTFRIDFTGEDTDTSADSYIGVYLYSCDGRVWAKEDVAYDKEEGEVTYVTVSLLHTYC